MHLYLSKSKPWRTNYSSEDGIVLYKVESPRSSMFSFGGENITINAKLPTSNDYVQIAEIEYHSGGLFSSDSRIRIGQSEMLAKDILRKGGFKWTGYG